MRLLRPLTLAATALLALAPATARAQQGRHFTDSWFLGAKAGLMTFWTPRVNHAPAPLAGIDMLITKKRAALYIAADESFFDENSIYPVYDTGTLSPDGSQLTPVGDAEVRIRDMHRVTAALMAFPANIGTLRTYIGVGMALNIISKANTTGGATGNLQEESMEDTRSTTAPLLIVGAQASLRRLSVFGQGSLMPPQSNFMINGRATFFLEGGVRWNLGAARDGAR